MERKAAVAYGITVTLPTLATATLLMSPSAAIGACDPGLCAYGTECFNPGECTAGACSGGNKQKCIKGEPPAWANCGAC